MNRDSTSHQKEHSKQTKSKSEELSNSLSIHGLPKIFVATNISQRLIWIFIFLGGLLTLAWMTYTRASSYLAYDVAWRETHDSRTTIAFPMIAICDYRIDHLDPSPGTIKLRACKSLLMDCMSYVEVSYAFGNTCMYINTSAIHQKVAGPGSGLQMSFVVEDTPPPQGDMEATYSQISLELHLFEDGQYPMQMRSRFLLSPKHHHDIPIEKWEVNRLPSPYPSKCKDGTLVSSSGRNPSLPNCNSTSSNNCSIRKYIYNDEACHDELAIQVLIAYCNSTEYAFYHDSNESAMIIDCLLDVFNISIDSIGGEDPCPLPCHTTVYQGMVNRLPWPDIYTQSDAFQAMREGIAREKVKEISSQNQERWKQNKSVMSMNLFYRDLSVVHFNETSIYTIPSLFSDLGGLMGLFLGASVYSLIELLLLVFVTIFDKCYNCGQREKISGNNKDEDI